MKKLIVLNHKMTLEYDEVYEYIETTNNINTDNNLIICPSNIYLENFINQSNWGIGAQNVSEHTEGNLTGEISTLQLKSLGVEYCLVGHYERVKNFNETPKQINKKLIACLESNIMPIVCFGETGIVEDAIKDLDEICANINHIDFVIFAYEPLKLKEVPDIKEIENDISSIYDYLKEKYNVIPNIIYGGGVRKDNIKQILELEKVNGVIIGKISSNKDKIKKIIENNC